MLVRRSDLPMDWNVPLPELLITSMPPQASMATAPQSTAGTPQPFLGPVSRLGWSAQSPVAGLPSTDPHMLPSGSPPPTFVGSDIGSWISSDTVSGGGRSHGPPTDPAFPAVPRSARRVSVPASAPGSASDFLTAMWETRSTPPLWSIGKDAAADDQGGRPVRTAMSADPIECLPTVVNLPKSTCCFPSPHEDMIPVAVVVCCRPWIL